MKRSFFPKKLMQWSEPKGIRLWRYEQEKAELVQKPWATVYYVFLVSTIIMAQWVVAYFTPERNPPPFKYALPLALAFSAFCLWLIFWLHSWVSYTGVVYADRVCIGHVQGAACIKTNKITECTIASVMTSEGALPLLTIHTAKSRRRPNVGIPPDKLPEVIATLASIGITVKHI